MGLESYKVGSQSYLSGFRELPCDLRELTSGFKELPSEFRVILMLHNGFRELLIVASESYLWIWRPT